jgi:FkbM family methyltransferase
MVLGQIKELARRIYRAIPFKRQLFGQIRRGPALPQAIYQHLHFEGPFSVRIDTDHSFRIHSDGSYVENELFWSGFAGGWEPVSLRVWAALCRHNDGLAIDVGANTGVYALTAAALGRDTIAFEPIERMARRLRHNVDLNRFPIRVEQMAVSDRSGSLPIYDDLTEHNYSASLEGQGASAVSYEVQVCALDDFLGELGNPAIAAIKIDVERHEPAVLRGMRRLLKEQRPALLIEILDGEIGRNIFELVGGLGYRLFHIDEQRGLRPASALGSIGDHNWNHLICTDEQFEHAGLSALLAPSGDSPSRNA